MLNISFLQEPSLMILVSGLIFGVIFFVSERSLHNEIKPLKPNKLIDSVLPWSRKAVFTFSTLWAVGLYIYSSYHFSSLDPALTFLTRMYGLSALGFLFLVLSVGLIPAYFPALAINKLLFRASRGIGLSVFSFAVLHAVCGFIANLDGTVSAIRFLSARNQIAIGCSSLALLILLAMAITSMDKVISWMTYPKWKFLHRFVHAAAVLILVHVYLIGSHFTVTTTTLPLLVSLTALTFLFLEAGAIYKKTVKKTGFSDLLFRHRLVLAGLILLICFGMGLATFALRSSYNPHAGHTLSYSNEYQIAISSESADIVPNQSTLLQIAVTQKIDNQPVYDFSIVQDKLMHLIVVSSDLSEFYHLHPDYKSNGIFTVDFRPAAPDTYYFFAEFLPALATEALATAQVTTMGENSSTQQEALTVTDTTQIVDHYEVSIGKKKRFKANKDIELAFAIHDLDTNSNVKDLEPYLSSAGHLAAIHEDKQTYVHVHPMSTKLSSPIRFYTKFPRPGRYKLFMQFQHLGQLHTASFVVEVEE